MVEGPGATRNARKVQPAIGCSVKHVESSALQANQQQQATTPCCSCPSELVGETLLEAFCIGKEVFLLFSKDEVAIRLHFGMNGSLFLSLDNGQQKPRPQWQSNYTRRQHPISIRIQFSPPSKVCTDNNFQESISYTLECYGTLVSRISANVAQSKRARLQSLDVCQSDAIFDARSVLEALQKRPDAMVCDAILDQNKFPGVGNIIKIEGLHKANVHPKRLVQNLSKTEIMTVVQQCRQYALAWLQRGRAPEKMVYNETNCRTCRTTGSVRMVKLGNDLSRVTFWCQTCQLLTPRTLMPTNETSNNIISTKRNFPLSKIQEDQTSSKKHRPETRGTNTCPQHGTNSFVIRRVRHKEENKNRLFGACKVRGCPYFAWADAHFPNCATCRRKTVLRVSKTEHSGGRWFSSCSTVSCKGTFAWATSQQLEPLGKFLTPLL